MNNCPKCSKLARTPLAKFSKEQTFENVIKYFKQSGISLADGRSQNEIDQLEKELNFQFPKDYHELHLKCNGFLDWDMNENNISIWTFNRISEEYQNERKQDLDFIPISDYLINSHWFGYIREKEGIYKDFDRTDPIAKDFLGFLDLILTDSNELY